MESRAREVHRKELTLINEYIIVFREKLYEMNQNIKSISLASFPNSENIGFLPAIFIGLIFAPFRSKWRKKHVIQQLRILIFIYDFAKITFIHPAIKAQ